MLSIRLLNSGMPVDRNNAVLLTFLKYDVVMSRHNVLDCSMGSSTCNANGTSTFVKERCTYHHHRHHQVPSGYYFIDYRYQRHRDPKYIELIAQMRLSSNHLNNVMYEVGRVSSGHTGLQVRVQNVTLVFENGSAWRCTGYAIEISAYNDAIIKYREMVQQRFEQLEQERRDSEERAYERRKAYDNKQRQANMRMQARDDEELRLLSM